MGGFTYSNNQSIIHFRSISHKDQKTREIVKRIKPLEKPEPYLLTISKMGCIFLLSLKMMILIVLVHVNN